MSELLKFIDILKNINPIFLLCFCGLTLYIIYKQLPKALQKKHEEYTSIFTELEKINKRLDKVTDTLNQNNEFIKEIFLYNLKKEIHTLRQRFNNGEGLPSQAEMDELYKMWDSIEILGDGHKEVKDSLDQLKNLMFA